MLLYPPNLSEKAKFLHLLAEVCDTLKPQAVTQLVQNGYHEDVFALNNVRMGRKHSLVDLIALIKVGLPDFVVPPALLPASAIPAPLFSDEELARANAR